MQKMKYTKCEEKSQDKLCHVTRMLLLWNMKQGKKIGTLLRQLREAEGWLIREIGAKMSIDPALISKIERNDRMPTKHQIAEYCKTFPEHADSIYIAWLSDKVLYEIQDDEHALQAIKAAESKIKYGAQ